MTFAIKFCYQYAKCSLTEHWFGSIELNWIELNWIELNWITGTNPGCSLGGGAKDYVRAYKPKFKYKLLMHHDTLKGIWSYILLYCLVLYGKVVL